MNPDLPTHRSAAVPLSPPGLGLQNGQTYTMRLLQPTPCTTAYLTFRNSTCGPLGAGLYVESWSSTVYKQDNWRVNVLGRIDVRGYRVTLQAASPYKAKLRCPGYLAVAKSGACPSGAAAGTVILVKSNKSSAVQWLMLPVPGYNNEFNVVAAGRRAGCPRYLGDSTPCVNLRPQLYQNDGGNGKQRWEMVASGNPPPLLPGAPKLTGHNLQRWYIDLLWEDGTPGTPEEMYTVACMQGGDPCDAEPVVAKNAVPRRTGRMNVGLPSAPLDLVCYVIATNAAGMSCSEGVPAKGRVLEQEDLPDVKFLAFETFLRLEWSWKVGLYPPESYKAWCVGVGQAYDAPPVTNVVTVFRNERALTVYGLQRSTNYTCFLEMNNGAVWYPFAEQVTTLARPFVPPQPPTDVQILNTSPANFTAVWKDGALAYPEEEYEVGDYDRLALSDVALSDACAALQVKCVQPGEPCESGGVDAHIKRGVQIGVMQGGIYGNTTYDCFVIAISHLSLPACSRPVRVMTIAKRAPSAPTGVGGVVTSMGWGTEWADAVSELLHCMQGGVQRRANVFLFFMSCSPYSGIRTSLTLPSVFLPAVRAPLIAPVRPRRWAKI